MITNILTIIFAICANSISSFDGNYSTIEYSNSVYSPKQITQENNNYTNLTEAFMKEIMSINESLKSLNDKVDPVSEKSFDLEKILTKPNQSSKNFYHTLGRVTNLMQLQQNIKDEKLANIINKEITSLDTYLHKHHSLFSFHNPFISSLLTVSVFGIFPCIMGCILSDNLHFIKQSVFFNAVFFTYLWVKKSISLNKKQQAFNENILPHIQKNEWDKYSQSVANNKQSFKNRMGFFFKHGIKEFE